MLKSMLRNTYYRETMSTNDVYLFPSAPNPLDVTLREAIPMPYAPFDLIDRACKYAREAYEEFKSHGFGITEPLTPKAIYGTQYLRLREDLNRGARKASHEIPMKHLRPVGFSILMMALYDIFHGKNQSLVKQIYNGTLRKYGIIPP